MVDDIGLGAMYGAATRTMLCLMGGRGWSRLSTGFRVGGCKIVGRAVVVVST